uniref:Tetraspanin n=1 Tax=Compsopogon caeruleus TaxID=31354 RepID=A0A6T6CPE0_9RHOD
MSTKEGNRFLLVFHTVVVTLVGVCGGLLLGLSIWATVNHNQEIFGLKYSGSSFLNVVGRLGILGIIVGGALVVAAILGYLSTLRDGCGTFWKIIYGIIASVLVLLLIAIAVGNLLFATRSNPKELENFFFDAWNESLKDPSYVAQLCQIEQTYHCRGFYDDSCNSTQQMQCPSCDTPVDPSITAGCWNKVLDDFKKYYYPVGILSAILALLLSMDLIAICAI